jgi:hypothetical protein
MSSDSASALTKLPDDVRAARPIRKAERQKSLTGQRNTIGISNLVACSDLFRPAQTPDQNPAISFQNRGTYSTYGNHTYGPHGTLQQRQGYQTYTIDRSGLGGPGPTYSTLGHQTYGSDGSVLYNYGNRSYDKVRAVAGG